MAQATLTDKQQSFAKEYCVDRNKTQAAIRAGYSQPTAAQAGNRAFRNVQVQREIAMLIREVEIQFDLLLSAAMSRGSPRPRSAMTFR